MSDDHAIAGRDSVDDLRERLRHETRKDGAAMRAPVVAGDRDSYQYLIESIRKFPTPPAFSALLAEAGFKRVTHTAFSGNIAALFSGWKL